MYLELAQGALMLYEQRRALEGIFSKLKFLIQNGRVRVAIFGPGGTGKTTLGHLLDDSDEKNALPPGAYSVSPTSKDGKLAGVPFGVVTVAPGQARRRKLHWPALYQDLSAGELEGLIFVVSWGYHSFDLESYTEHELYTPGMSTDEFMRAWLAKAREDEINVLKELAPHIISSKQKKLWMITLVTKQDLWWDRRQEVKRHYSGGEYQRVIESIRAELGNRGFDHDYLSASLEIVNLATARDGNLATTVGGYDQRLQAAHLSAFHDRFLQLCGV